MRRSGPLACRLRARRERYGYGVNSLMKVDQLPSGVTEWSGHSTAGGTPAMIPVQDTYHLISQGSGPSMVMRFNYDVTVNPDGTMTVSSIDNFSLVCG